ncbi:MAG: DUF86 domain-containing protein [Parcubacteria group bacterium]|nr:DUF86 domain-containing protein [Parcubacteria group bacterium]
MTSPTNIENKISLIEKYLGILERYQKYSREEIEHDIDIRGAVERYLYLAAQATIELAETVIAYKKFRKPTSMSENFSILNEEGVISLEFSENLIKMTGFRNVIAHDYDNIDYDIVYDVLHHKLNNIKKFIELAEDLI